jgi:hypothetical protein
VEVHKPNVILIQEKMGDGDKVIRGLGNPFKNWEFWNIDVVYNSRESLWTGIITLMTEMFHRATSNTK